MAQFADIVRVVGSTARLTAPLVLGLLLYGCEFFGGTDVVDVEIPATFSVPLPVQLPSSDAIDAAPVEGGVRQVSTPAAYVPIDLTQIVPDLARYQGNVKSVRVNSITHNIVTNSFSVTLDAIDIRIGSTGADYDSATSLGQTVSVPPRSVGDLPARISEVGRSNASLHMSTLSYGLGTQATFVIPEGETPTGNADTNLIFDITVVANPVD